MAADDLYGLAAQLLDVAVAALDVTPAGTPERRYVSVGPPPHDCEQLVAWIEQVSPYPAGVQAGGALQPHARLRHSAIVWEAVVRLEVARCWPTRNVVPSAPELADGSLTLYRDAWVLWNAVAGGLRAATLWAPTCKDASIGLGQPVPPEGGFAAWGMVLSTRLDGYQA